MLPLVLNALVTERCLLKETTYRYYLFISILPLVLKALVTERCLLEECGIANVDYFVPLCSGVREISVDILFLYF